MKKQIFTLALASTSMLTFVTTEAVILAIKNHTNSYMIVQTLAKHNVVIDQYELAPQELKVTFSSSRTIEHIVWQMQYGLYVKTPCYTLDVTIPWYYFFAGVIKLSATGAYESTFFGNGKLKGHPCNLQKACN